MAKETKVKVKPNGYNWSKIFFQKFSHNFRSRMGLMG